MPEPRLEPCPFCSSRQLTVEHHSTGTGQHHYVNCTNCGADGPGGESRGEAITRWNRRPKKGDGHE